MTPDQLTQIRQGLTAQPGLLGREDYMNAAVLMLLILLDGEYHFVLQDRPLDIRQGGEVSFPGGKFDPDQDLDTAHTAIRETVEEMGIPEDRLVMLGALGTIIHAAGMIIDAYVGLGMIQGLNELHINPSEVKSAFTIPVSRFERAVPEEYHALVQIHPTHRDDRSGQEQILLPSRQLGLPERYAQPWGSGLHRVLVYRIDGHLVWGTTARLIKDFTKRL